MLTKNYTLSDNKIILDPQTCLNGDNILSLSSSKPTMIDIIIVNGNVSCTWTINNTKELWILRSEKSYELPNRPCEITMTDLDTFISYDIMNYLIEWDKNILTRNILHVQNQVKIRVTCKHQRKGSLWTNPPLHEFSTLAEVL